jgi:hypothetical protein
VKSRRLLFRQSLRRQRNGRKLRLQLLWLPWWRRAVVRSSVLLLVRALLPRARRKTPFRTRKKKKRRSACPVVRRVWKYAEEVRMHWLLFRRRQQAGAAPLARLFSSCPPYCPYAPARGERGWPPVRAHHCLAVVAASPHTTPRFRRVHLGTHAPS